MQSRATDSRCIAWHHLMIMLYTEELIVFIIHKILQLNNFLHRQHHDI